MILVSILSPKEPFRILGWWLEPDLSRLQEHRRTAQIRNRSLLPERPEPQPAFTFDGFVFDRVALEVLPRVPPDEGETLQPGIQCDVSPKANIVVDHDRKRAELTMSFKFTADPKKQPYVIEITIVGAFGLQAGTIDHLTQFAKAGAASVLFPFVREMIYQVTRDARWGPLRLNPINMQEILKWQQNVEEISGPSEPEQQREQ